MNKYVKENMLDIVDSQVDKEMAEEIVKAWAKNKKINVDIISSNRILYPFYFGECFITIRRIPPLSPREILHRWFFDSITGQPFMVPEKPGSKEEKCPDNMEILSPVIKEEAIKKDMIDHSQRYVIRFYKYFFTPDIVVEEINLMYVMVWIFRFKDNKNDYDRFIGVNSWSGNPMELEN
ncbi:hypothetical protein [Natranaerofaba carboxydovora]|uniref:hypothetical protein n=1 Tax=Natranaerofaba carboxydovora TaxID=2742683 RepID=UPI001F144DA7|nr:hypothetical protein [Natranaerofaba carboxydovora]UMZ72786.1 hypothetical protein ACONDI_00314 [Natranaerofaba carboxydovora]